MDKQKLEEINHPWRLPIKFVIAVIFASILIFGMWWMFFQIALPS